MHAPPSQSCTLRYGLPNPLGAVSQYVFIGERGVELGQIPAQQIGACQQDFDQIPISAALHRYVTESGAVAPIQLVSPYGGIGLPHYVTNGDQEESLLSRHGSPAVRCHTSPGRSCYDNLQWKGTVRVQFAP